MENNYNNNEQLYYYEENLRITLIFNIVKIYYIGSSIIFLLSV